MFKSKRDLLSTLVYVFLILGVHKIMTETDYTLMLIISAIVVGLGFIFMTYFFFTFEET